MTQPPLPFRIVNWIGIIDQLASTEANRTLKPLGLQMPEFVLLTHFSHRPEEARTVTGVARALQQPQPGVTKNVQKLVAKEGVVSPELEGVITEQMVRCHAPLNFQKLSGTSLPACVRARCYDPRGTLALHSCLPPFCPPAEEDT